MRREIGIVRLTTVQFELLRGARTLTLRDATALPVLAPLARVTQSFVQHHLGRASRALAAAGGRS